MWSTKKITLTAANRPTLAILLLEFETLKRYERTGRPLGLEAFVDQLEKLTSRILKKQKPGPKKSN